MFYEKKNEKDYKIIIAEKSREIKILSLDFGIELVVREKKKLSLIA